MRLNQRRRGGLLLHNNIGATRSQGIWAFPWSSYGCLYHCVSIKEKEGRTWNHPGYAPHSNKLTSA